jgi:multicomponent Na+:H+ antiporter subunit F
MTQLFAINMMAIVVVLTLAMLVTFVRLALGPVMADRVVALDLIAVNGTGVMAAAAIAFEVPALLDVGLVLAMIGFVGTAAFARYIERGATPHDDR